MPTIAGPRVLEKPAIVYIGESWKPRADVKDGVKTAALPFGAALTVAAATIKGVLTVNKPDGTTDLTKDTSVSGEGEKSDPDTEGFNNAFQFYVAATATASWVEGIHDFEVEYQDTAPTTDDKRLVLVGRVEVRAKPSAT